MGTVHYAPSTMSNLRRLRLAARLTQTALAEQMDTTRVMIRRYEDGRMLIPQDLQARLSERFSVSVSHLLGVDLA